MTRLTNNQKAAKTRPSSSRRRLISVLIISVVASASMGAAAPADPDPANKQKVRGIQNCVKPKVRPNRIVFTCADGGIYANNLFWRTWGPRKARAGAVLHAPESDGTPASYAATVILHNVKRRTCNGKTGRFFTRVRLQFPLGPAPEYRIPTRLACV